MPGKSLSESKHAQIMLLHNDGWSQRRISKKLNASRYAVQWCIKRSTDSSVIGEIGSRRKSGQPKTTSQYNDKKIIQIAQLSQSAAVSTHTIRHRLFDAGLKSRRFAKKPLLPSKIKDRIAFCEKYCHWTEDQWENVLFSDESTFTQFYSFSRHVRRPVGKKHDTRYCTSAV